MTEEIARGAEAVIYQEQDTIIKKRVAKTYRHPELDASLRKQRTRKEAKLLTTLTNLQLPTPHFINLDESTSTITMSLIDGGPLKDHLDTNPSLASQVGTILSTLHDHNIIHGDLTTSNLLLTQQQKVYLIDFGLSFHSAKLEDKAVDVHLFHQSLASKHVAITDEAWNAFLQYYNPQQKEGILARLSQVQKRGRNKA